MKKFFYLINNINESVYEIQKVNFLIKILKLKSNFLKKLRIFSLDEDLS